MKTDIERICRVARMGGCECRVDNHPESSLVFFPTSTRLSFEWVNIKDAVVRLPMIRAFDEAMFKLKLYRYITPPLSGDSVARLVYAQDRIAWVIEHVVEPVEKAME